MTQTVMLDSGPLFEPITVPVLRQAAAFWAQARHQGKPAAPDLDLDTDMILAAQAVTLASQVGAVIVATTNVRHLVAFVDARLRSNVLPGQQ